MISRLGTMEREGARAVQGLGEAEGKNPTLLMVDQQGQRLGWERPQPVGETASRPSCWKVVRESEKTWSSSWVT